jgi:hypothetical protein
MIGVYALAEEASRGGGPIYTIMGGRGLLMRKKVIVEGGA